MLQTCTTQIQTSYTTFKTKKTLQNSYNPYAFATLSKLCIDSRKTLQIFTQLYTRTIHDCKTLEKKTSHKTIRTQARNPTQLSHNVTKVFNTFSHNFTQKAQTSTTFYNFLHNCPSLYTTTDNFTQLYTSLQTTSQYFTPHYNTLFHYAKLERNSTTLFETLQKLYTSLYNFIKILKLYKISTKLYKTVQSSTLFRTLRHFTQLYKNKLCKTIQNITILYNNFTKLYKALHKSTQLYKTLYNFTILYKIYKTPQNSTQLQNTLHNFCTTFHIYTKLRTTIHNSTKLYNSVQFYTTLYNYT